MLKWGRSFTDSVSFDITYNLVRGLRYGVGIFTGFDTNLRILPLGIVLIQS
jgi:hypothetical protein